MEKYLSKFSYELVYTPLEIKNEEYPDIRDKDDLPILASAINSDVDIIVTGDKAFFELNIEKPEILFTGDKILHDAHMTEGGKTY